MQRDQIKNVCGEQPCILRWVFCEFIFSGEMNASWRGKKCYILRGKKLDSVFLNNFGLQWEHLGIEPCCWGELSLPLSGPVGRGMRPMAAGWGTRTPRGPLEAILGPRGPHSQTGGGPRDRRYTIIRNIYLRVQNTTGKLLAKPTNGSYINPIWKQIEIPSKMYFTIKLK